MAKKFHLPVRMCLSCRQRFNQNELIRLQCLNSELLEYTQVGRSFYLCENCLKEEKKISKSLMRQCRSADRDKFMNKLKEIIADDRKG